MGNGPEYVREDDSAKGRPRRDGRAMLAALPLRVSRLIDIESVPPREAGGDPWSWQLLMMRRLGPHITVSNHLHTCDIVNDCSTFFIYLKTVRHMIASTTLNCDHTKRDPTAAQLPVDLLVLRAAR